MLFIMHRHQVCTRGFGPTAELDMNKEEHLMTTNYIDFFHIALTKKTYIGVSEVERSFEVFDTDTAQFVPVSEAVHITRFRHRKPRSDICMACNKP